MGPCSEKLSVGVWQWGLPTPYLPKNEARIAACPILRGNFHIKLLLKYGFEKFGFSYSNEFLANIAREMLAEVTRVPKLF